MTEALAAAASATAVEAYKDVRNIIGSIDGAIDYAKNLEKNYERLKEDAKKLYARRDDLLAKINTDKRKQATKECEVWICKVKKIEKEVLNLEAEYEEQKKHHRFWQYPNLSKCMAEKLDDLCRCWAEGSSFATGVVVERSPEPIIKVKAPRIEDKSSLLRTVEKIMELLRDDDVKRIGVWGMVGVGKSAILQNLNNNEQIAKMFDIIIFVALTDEGNEEELQHAKIKLKCAKQKLQCEIAQRLKLNVEGLTDTKRIASRIFEELECKRYLLLLDGVWESFNLDDVGIYENEKDSKVVLASRYRDVCMGMCVDDIVRVESLSEVDARKLFLEKLGRHINLSDFDPVIPLVIRECANLPLVIDIVAKTFRKKDRISLWWAGLKRLQKWPNINDQAMDEVLDRLRFCYEELGKEDKKVCFLYVALFTEGCNVYMDYLLECWRAEGFIRDADEFTARDRGQEILNDLINVSLLESSEMKHIKMNKVLRNMALKISSEKEDSKCLVKTHEEILQPLEEEEWKQAKRISLMDNKLCSLPERPDSNNLSTLLLQRNGDLTMIPEQFFGSMQNLRVLDLHGTKITTLPLSLSCLQSLRALYLNCCNQLIELPSRIDTLQHLEVLDIRGTKINYLPIEVGCLRQLRCLRTSFSNIDGRSRRMEIFRNIIAKLSLLEELVIDVRVGNQWWNEVAREMSEEVSTLTKLTSLSFCFPGVDILKIFIMKNSMWKHFCFAFQFSIGQYHSHPYRIVDYFEYEVCKCLKYANGEGIDAAIKEVLATANALELLGNKGVLKLSDYGVDNLNKLRSCLIESCNEMETIIDGNGITNVILQSLEKMYISNLPMLKSIWEGSIPTGSLAQLATLIFYKCPKLKKIFSKGLIQQLCKLQHLEVEDCEGIEEIIIEAENNGLESRALPSLKKLILLNLPRLRSIWIDDSLEWPSLERTVIAMCPLLERYP